MNAELQQWLSELRRDGVDLAGEFGGANANLWSISLPTMSPIAPEELAAFIHAAAQIRAELVAGQTVSPVTFYAWHDEMAGQLRFSTARCTLDLLPFSASVCLAEDPAEIVEDFLASPSRDGLSWTTLRDDLSPEQGSGLNSSSQAEVELKVWARQLA